MSLKPVVAALTVTTAGTQVQCISTVTYSPFIYIEAKDTNTGSIYVGDLNVSSSLYIAKLSAGQGVNIGADFFGRTDTQKLDLSTVWIDSSVNGEIAMVTYLQRQDSA